MDLTDRLAAVAAVYEAHRNAPFPRWNILAEYEQQLLSVITELDDYGREYYQRLLDMAELVLEADSPSSSA